MNASKEASGSSKMDKYSPLLSTAMQKATSSRVVDVPKRKEQARKEQIVVIGALNIDIVSYTKTLPREGETVHGTHFETDFGGKAANQSVAIAKLGGNAALVGRLGDDTMATDYLERLTIYGVDTTNVQKTKGVSNGTAMLMVGEDGTHFNAIVSGANANFIVNDINRSKECIKEACVVVCQLEVHPEVSLLAMEMAGGITILDATPAMENAYERIFTTPAIFVVHETEASVFCGFPVRNMGDAKLATKELLRRGCNSVIVVMGTHGAVYASRHEPNPIHVPGPTVKSVDSVSHGDAFVGSLAFLLGYFKDEMNMERILKAAAHCAADSTTRKGIHVSFTNEEELLAFLKTKF